MSRNVKAYKIADVNSTDIKALEWDGSNILQVIFRSDPNCTYTYKSVPPAFANRLQKNNDKRDLQNKSTDKYSVGKFFQENIKKDTEIPFDKKCGK